MVFLVGVIVFFKDLRPGDRARVTSYLQGNASYNRQLMTMGLVPGTVFEIKQVAPLGDPVEIIFRGFRLSLRAHEASVIQVERV